MPYDPRYDTPLGPMSSRPVGGAENPLPHDETAANVYGYHKEHYLGPLPHESDTSREADAASALQTLFGETDVAQGLAAQDGQIETLAEGAAAAEAAEAAAQAEANATSGSMVIDPNLQHSAMKRKATSRANMLARGGACDFCKRRKLKCSAETPTCANCVKASRECVYSQKRQRSRVKVLEDRLQELERKLAAQQNLIENGQSAPANSSQGGDKQAGNNAAARLSHNMIPTVLTSFLPTFSL
ncbi:uncharacterized protein L203_103282 [Cryptococcus depauperatus CBS 7841]|uniref:Zn(2)-C6 fungal-type domain-containing protein n=1 Tax=Cryptococcus depauperatus CBS 7841 TaxID=1295531 RepID=A0AAJ8JT93_9TREE